MTETIQPFELKIKPSFLAKEKTLVINSLGITWGKKFLLFNDIKGLRYGAIDNYVNGIKVARNYIIDCDSTQKLKIILTSSPKLFSKPTRVAIEKTDEQYGLIVNALWEHYTSKVVKNMINKLNSGETVRVGNFEVGQKGITVFYRHLLFSKREAVIPWSKCLKGTGPGYLFVNSSENKRIMGKSRFLQTWDLNALYSLLNYLWEHGRCYTLEKGEKI